MWPSDVSWEKGRLCFGSGLLQQLLRFVLFLVSILFLGFLGLLWLGSSSLLVLASHDIGFQ